jgi:Tol biopolymer transport system component
MAGRIGLISLRTGDMRILTLGIDWHDASPSWRPDGGALVVIARRPGEANTDVHLLTTLGAAAGQVERRPITLTGALEETSPVYGPDGTFVVFVRQDNLVRMDLGSGRTRRLTGGFRRMRQPRFLPTGLLLALWREDKRFGIDVMEEDGKNRVTLAQGSTFYRTVGPSPDGRFFVATYTFDLGFHPIEALKPRPTEEVRLLDGQGRAVATLARSWRHSSHSPEWAP